MNEIIKPILSMYQIASIQSDTFDPRICIRNRKPQSIKSKSCNNSQKSKIKCFNLNQKRNDIKTKALRGVAIHRGRSTRTPTVFPPAGATAAAFRLPTPLATAAAASSANLHGFAP